MSKRSESLVLDYVEPLLLQAAAVRKQQCGNRTAGIVSVSEYAETVRLGSALSVNILALMLSACQAYKACSSSSVFSESRNLILAVFTF